MTPFNKLILHSRTINIIVLKHNICRTIYIQPVSTRNKSSNFPPHSSGSSNINQHRPAGLVFGQRHCKVGGHWYFSSVEVRRPHGHLLVALVRWRKPCR
ncbi:hypothetical protein HanIR_Chr03g0145781 [Helianthus annuus]|nr:hypothetical protein HanIR_Chr03g0145781 [Helianthus annuus]